MGKEEGRTRDRPGLMTSFWVYLNGKEEYQLWKGSQILIKDKSLARICRDAVRKVKAPQEMKLAEDVKKNKGPSDT